MSDREPEGEYTDTDQNGQPEEPPTAPSGSYVDKDETHLDVGRAGAFTDHDGEPSTPPATEGTYTDSDQ